MKVRALAINAVDQPPALVEVEVAGPGPGQVQVRVEAASINGIDSAAATGYLWQFMAHEFPVVLGRDFAETVTAVGADVADLTVGQRVSGVYTKLDLLVGAIAEVGTYDADILSPVPAVLSSTDAAAVGLTAITALDMVDTAGITGADTVLVVGATGGVGGYAVQFAAATGATVIGTARDDVGAAFVRGLGAEHVVDFADGLEAAVRAVAPDGVTVVLHSAGDPAAFAATLRPAGRVASCAQASNEAIGRDDVTVNQVIAHGGSAKLARLLGQVADGTLRVPAPRLYPFAHAAQALSDFGAAPKRGKLVVTFD